MDNKLSSIEIDNLTITYDRHPVIHHLSCEFKMGLSSAIVGPNGAGKSTLLKALLGHIPLDAGTVQLCNINNRDIAYLPQISELDVSLPFTVEDLILLGAWYDIGFYSSINKQHKIELARVLHEVGLSGFNKVYIHQLSYGQLRRVLFAKISFQKAKIVLLDEPFNGIDNQTTSDLLNLIKLWQHKYGVTTIAVLHDLHQVKQYFDYTMLISRQLIDYDATSIVLNKLNLRKAYSQSMAHDFDELCNID